MDKAIETTDYTRKADTRGGDGDLGTGLNPRQLYVGDNGRCTCGAMRCAGATAHYSGRDLSGQAMAPLTAREAIAHGLRCEGCGMSPSLVVLS